ncbi:MAG: hypothetical protein QG577_209, partial [Thermodesulfobacteriota bacterium]|nr:hypothetical protein [Thermodesulfobacteriota bacterium]
TTDTEVLLNGYLEYGERILERLNGMFAFAIHDSRSGKLFLARDNWGVKPLYYAETAKGFLFASELKALLLEDTVSRRINYRAVHAYLTYLWAPAPLTMLESVKKLEPGLALEVAQGKILNKWTFYSPPLNQIDEAIREDDAARSVKNALETAVERQMVADVPVGAFLSGGLDSSAICCMARKYTRDRLQCFTISAPNAQDEGFVDDLTYAKLVHRYLDVDLHVIEIHEEMSKHLPEMIYHLDEPQADPSAINVMLISKLAREHGIKVLLSGAGADDVLAGYRRHYALLLEKYWAWLPISFRRQLTALTGRFNLGKPLFRRLEKAFRFADLDGDERIASYFKWMHPSQENTVYSRETLNELSKQEGVDPLVQTLSALPGDVVPLNRLIWLDFKHYLTDHNLNYTDKMSMARSVETRVPFLDPDFVSLAFRLPVQFKQRGRIGKYVLKKAMKGHLPDEVLQRPKTGFGAPVRQWIRHELRPLVEDLLDESNLRKRGLFSPDGVKKLMALDRDGKIDVAYPILAMVCIELWCKTFLDQGTPAPLTGLL